MKKSELVQLIKEVISEGDDKYEYNMSIFSSEYPHSEYLLKKLKKEIKDIVIVDPRASNKIIDFIVKEIITLKQ